MRLLINDSVWWDASNNTWQPRPFKDDWSDFGDDGLMLSGLMDLHMVYKVNVLEDE